MTPQDLTSAYIPPSEFTYTPSGPAPPYATHHHPLSVGSGGCPSSQQSSDDDLTFYSNSLVGSESGNVTTSLYGLVTGNPSCFSTTSSAPLTPPNYSPHHLHPHTPHSSHHPHHHHHHSHSHNNNHHPPSSRSSHPPSSSASSSHSHASYTPLPTATPPRHPRAMNDLPSSFKSLAPHHHTHHTTHSGRKRKSPVPRVESEEDSETCSSRRTATPTDENSKKQNHSEIEKRRRDKMNLYIAELSGMVPMCSAMSRKLDKLTVLRMAVQHMKTLRGSRVHSYTQGHYKPSFLTDDELKHLILQSAEGFLFVVGCDRGRLLYVSESVAGVLNHSQSDLLGQSWFDILHPKDVAKVKEQLSSSDLAPRERLIDAKTMLPVKGNVPQKANRLCPGARRSFFCRMKVKGAGGGVSVKEEVVEGGGGRRKKGGSERKYSVIHCTGYLKSWAKVGMEDAEGGDSDDPCNLSCLVAVGRNLNPIASPSPNPQHRPVTFISRHAIDGKFLFVDQRTTLVVGFLPQELLGTSVYEYFHQEDIQLLADVHKHVLLTHEPITTQLYRFRTRAGPFVKLTSNWKAFRNPWTREIECIIAKNTLAPEHNSTWTFASYHDFLDVDDDCADGSDNCREDGGTTRRAEAFSSAPEFDFFGGESEGGRLGTSYAPFGGGGGGGGGLGNRDIHRLINSEVPCRKIGEQIAEEVIEGQRRCDSSSSSSPASNVDGLRGSASPVSLGLSPSAAPTHSLLSTHQGSSPSAAAPGTSGLSSPIEEGTGGGGGSSQSEGAAEGLTLSCRTNDPIIGASAAPTVPHPRRTPLRTANEQGEEEMLYMIGESVLPESPQGGPGDGNDEAAMAVIMSLLEADAGLGGPVDFSGLPWPLP